jgi:hypothetical protein
MDKVRVGLPVRITVDALPGRSFTGRVARVAPLPDAQSVWMNPDLKVYRTEIHIDGDASDLRTGMSCRAEIIVSQIPEATFVPLQSILRVGGQPTVYVVGSSGQSEPRRIELGMDNNRMAHIVSGIQPGERVLLAPPLAEASAPKLDETFEFPPPATPTAAAPAAAPEPVVAHAPAGDESPDQSEQEERPRGRRVMGDMGNMTPEQMQEMRRRFENMTPEEREAARRQFQRAPGREGGREGDREGRDETQERR